MTFRDCRQGYPVYVLDRTTVTVMTGKVSNTPIPHLDNSPQGVGRMVVDLSVEAGGNRSTYVLDDSGEVGYAGSLVISCTREGIAREVESMKTQSEEALKMADYHAGAVEKCDALLREYSPEYRERTEYSERISGVEQKVDRLAEAIDRLLHRREDEVH